MATGVEVAGVILGSLPLLIAALEHYEDILRPTVDFFSWKKYRRWLRKELYILRTSFDEGVRILLRDVDIAEPEAVTAMLDDPQSNLWVSGPIADILRDTLGPTYDPFILTIIEIDEILMLIMKHLNIEGAQIANGGLRDIVMANAPIAKTAHPKRNFEFAKQVAFTMKKKDIKTNLKRVEDCTERIDAWITKAEKGRSSDAAHHGKLDFADLRATQASASKLHRILCRSWCKGPAQHSSFLLLEQRLRRPRRNKRAHHEQIAIPPPDANHFKISIRVECYLQTPQFNTEIRVVDAVATVPPLLAASAPSISPKARRVGFSTAGIQSVEQEPPYGDPSVLPHITEFCHYIQRPVHAHTGFCLDQQEGLRAYSSSATSVQYVRELMTLDAILPNLQEKLPLDEVYGLSITLVASIFQLSQTPWLESVWSKKDIVFLRASGDLPLVVDIKFPYLMQKFPRNQHTATTEPGDCSKFLALAIMLLEINFGKPIEHLYRSEDQAEGRVADETINLHTANRWLKAKNSRLTMGF